MTNVNLNTYVDPTSISLRPISKLVAKEWIERHHYTQNMNGCRYALGVYVKGNVNKFFDLGETLIGAIIYAHPVSNKAIDSICGTNELTLNEVLELIRLHIADGYGKNIESYVIGQSFKWIRENDSAVKVLISYADPEMGHAGKIYQATNWLYQGCGVSKLMPDYSIRLDENGPWMHSRTVSERFGNKKIENLARAIGHTFWRKEETSKHRYIYFLTDKKETKRLKKLLKLPVIKYSELQPVDQLIQKITVDASGAVLAVDRISGTGDGSFTMKSGRRI